MDIKPETSTGYEPKLLKSDFMSFIKGLNIPMFTGNPVYFFTWRTRMAILLEMDDMKDLVDAETLEVAQKVPHFVEKSRAIRNAIFFTVDGPVMTKINGLTCGWEMWHLLNTEYNRQDSASRYDLFAQIWNFRYKGNGIRAHCDDIISLMDLLAAKKMVLEEELKVCVLLFSLPAEFSAFVTSLHAQVGVSLTVDVVRTRVIAEEARMLRTTGHELALFSQNRSTLPQQYMAKRKHAQKDSKKKGRCHKCGKEGHFKRECPKNALMAAIAYESDLLSPVGKREKLSTERITCVENHTSSKKKDEVCFLATSKIFTEGDSKDTSFKSYKIPKKQATALYVDTSRDLVSKQSDSTSKMEIDTKPRVKGLAVLKKKKIDSEDKLKNVEIGDRRRNLALLNEKLSNDKVIGDADKSRSLLSQQKAVNKTYDVSAYSFSFVIDSGASSHMVRSPSVLENFHADMSSIGQAEEGRRLRSIGCGILKCELAVEPGLKAGRVYAQLKDVLVVPSLSVNILSVAKLSEHNFKVVFNGQSCSIYHPSGRLMASAEKRRGLYWLRALVKKEQVLIALKPASKLELWHQRLGHLNDAMIKKMITSEGFAKDKLNCVSCIEGKMARAPFKKSTSVSSDVFELVHSDVCGPLPVNSSSGHRYFVTFIDDKSRFCFIYLMKQKSEVFSKFKEFMAMAQNVFDKKIKTLRTDNGGEYLSTELRLFMKTKGIQYQTTVAYTPQQNGVAERMNRTLMETVRCQLFGAKLRQRYWDFAVLCAAYVRNRCWTNNLKLKSPYEVLHGKTPNLAHLRVFGCTCYVQVPEEKRRKLDARAVKCLFLGYSSSSKAYIVQQVKGGRIYTSRDVKFLEHDFGGRVSESTEQLVPVSVPHVVAPHVVDNVLRQGESVPQPPAVPSVIDLTKDNDEDHWEMAEEDFHASGQQESVDVRASPQTSEGSMSPRGDEHHEHLGSGAEAAELADGDALNNDFDPQPFGEKDYMGSRYVMQSVDVPPAKDINAPPQRAKRQSYYRQEVEERALVMIKGPETYRSAMREPDSVHWLKAMEEELESLKRNETWSLVPPPKNRKIVDCRWVLGIKQDVNGKPERYKARLCARGFTQEYGVDYDETFSPVAHFNSIRVFLAVAVWLKMNVQQMDVKTAFLNGQLEEEIYMRQPPGFEVKGKETHVCKLQKSLYGLKQSPRQWNITMNEFLNGIGFKNCTADPCVYLKKESDKMIMIALYVDDLIIGSNCSSLMNQTKQNLNERFAMKDLGQLKFCLGIEVRWNKDGTCALRQKHYVLETLEKFNMADCKPVSTPMAPGQKLSKAMCATTDNEKAQMANVPYRSAVGSLIYMVTGTRPDIAVAVGEVSKYLENPGEQHWMAVKRILRYLKGTADWSLICKTDSINLVGYADADWAGDLDSRRSTTGYVFQIGGFPVCWKSKRQPTVALSTSEAEYMSIASAAQTAVWLRRLLQDLGFTQDKATEIFEDNQGCIAMAKNPINHERTKHIDIKYHFIREMVESALIKLTYLQTEDMLADVLTKGLARDRHQRLCSMIGLQELTVEGEC
jgi:hypothetical protein